VENNEVVLERKLVSLFPDCTKREKVVCILETYGVESYEQESVRVRLAILKLSDNSVREVRKNTQYAKEDFRDILAWAESPNLGKVWNQPDGPEKQKVIDLDRANYSKWLEE
jgi:hypothetical protein